MSDETVTSTDWMCPNCGDTITLQEPCESWPCSYCGTEMVSEDKSDVVPKDDLRELIDQWREEREDVLGNETATDSAKAHRNGVACGMDYCIEELEALLND